MLYTIADDVRSDWLERLAEELVCETEDYLAKWAAFEAYAPPPVRVLLVDDSDLFRAALEVALSSHARVEVVGHARNGHEAVRTAEELAPDVVVLDLEMPVMGGLESARAIRAARPGARVVIVTGSRTAGPEEARAAGALALLRKTDSTELADEIVSLSLGAGE